MNDFDGRTALVTGAGSGIGQAMAEQLRDRGARVIGVDLDPAGVPAGCEPHGADVSDPGSASTMLDRVGPVDVLMNNAGIGSTTDILGCTAEEWDRVFAVNVRSVFLWTQAFLPSMLANRRGAIVNTASVAARSGCVTGRRTPPRRVRSSA